MADRHPEEWKTLCARAAVEKDAGHLFKLIKRINDLLDKKQARLERKRPEKSAHIFQIAYDEILLITRAEFLEERGLDVESALGNADAKLLLAKGGGYRVFLVGYRAPRADREDVIAWIRTKFRDATIIAITDKGEPPIEIADYNFVRNGPEGWFTIAEAVVRKDARNLKSGTA